jgi:hypothetical protein
MSAKETIERLIRQEFDKTDWWNDEKINELINTATSYGLKELAQQMNYERYA